MSVALSVHSDLPLALRTASEYAASQGVDGAVAAVATFLFTQFRVVGAHEAALEFLEKYGKREFKLGGLRRLPVSGAFHTRIMEDAAREFRSRAAPWPTTYGRTKQGGCREHLKQVKFGPPAVRVHSNLDGRAFPGEAKEIRRRLFKSLCLPVKALFILLP